MGGGGDEEDAPQAVEVPESTLGMLIGRNGSTIKRLIQATGCQIELPRTPKPPPGEESSTRMVSVQLVGRPEQRRRAAAAVLDVAAGGEAEDHAARSEGAMVVDHALDHRDREAWAHWRLTASEKEHGVRVEMGRRAVRVWAEKRGGLVGPAAEKVRAVVNAAIAAARELVELEVAARLDTDAENAQYDPAVAPLVDQCGVLVRIPQPEDGVIKLRVVGPTESARDVALLLEARYSKGKFTASVLTAAGQVQSMAGQMSGDFLGDMRSLEAEYRVKVKESHHVVWIVGENAEGVTNARRTLVDMLKFYLPDGFFLMENLPQSCINDLRTDSAMRALAMRPNCAVAFDRIQGTAWICGGKEEQEAVKKRIQEFLGKWEESHWEKDLEDYGVAMWLLGPKGSGDYLHRMQLESGAKIKVCPNNLKVWIEGEPARVQEGKRLILDALEQLEARKRADAAGTGPGVKKKELLSDHPPHMKAILEKLAMLEAMKRGGPPPPELLRGREPDPLAAPEPEPPRERSRSRDAGPRASATVMEWNPATGQMEASTMDIDVGGGSAAPAPAPAAAPAAPAPAPEPEPEAALSAEERRRRALEAAAGRAVQG